MISAFFSLSGRVDSAHAALVTAHAGHHAGMPVTLLRIVEPGEATLPESHRTATFAHIEKEVGTTAQASLLVHETIAAALGAGHDVVLDLPRTCMRDEAIRSRLAVAIVAVGPTPFDEHAAATALADGRNTTTAERAAKADEAELPGTPVPPWFLGCSRAGGTHAASAFAKKMRALAAERGGPTPRVVPLALPALTRLESERFMAGIRDPRVLDSGEALLDAIRAIARTPRASAIRPAELGVDPTSIGRDSRGASDRLRELADDLDGIAAGVKPTRDDLDDAPVLAEWERASLPKQVMTGLVRGHPNFPAGRRVATSEIYATDGRSWIRTASRFYRLPARPSSASRSSH